MLDFALLGCVRNYPLLSAYMSHFIGRRVFAVRSTLLVRERYFTRFPRLSLLFRVRFCLYVLQFAILV